MNEASIRQYDFERKIRSSQSIQTFCCTAIMTTQTSETDQPLQTCTNQSEILSSAVMRSSSSTYRRAPRVACHGQEAMMVLACFLIGLSFKENAQVLAQDDKTDIDIPPEQAILKYNNTCDSAVRPCPHEVPAKLEWRWGYRMMDPQMPYSPYACIDKPDKHYCAPPCGSKALGMIACNPPVWSRDHDPTKPVDCDQCNKNCPVTATMPSGWPVCQY